MIDYLKVINVQIPYITPTKLEALGNGLKSSDKFSDIQSSFEFPPKDISLVIEFFLNSNFDKINFFDVLTLSLHLKKDDLEIEDKRVLTLNIEKFFNQSQKYIQNLILNTVATIYLSSNSFKNVFLKNLKSKEFLFLKLCVEKDYIAIQKIIKNQNIKNLLKFFGINNIFSNLVLGYSNFLLNEIAQRKLDKSNLDKYKNNLLFEDDLKNLNNQVDRLITFIENKIYPEKIDEILSKLGGINKWHTFNIDGALQDRYKRLKGLFEFQRFVKIVKYLTTNPNINFSEDAYNTDKRRLKNRTTFWSNYDARFSSVKMWVSESDYREMAIDKPVDLRDIKQLENINNEVCMLEFKENNLLIIEFFRLRDNYTSFESLIFVNNIEEIKSLLEEEIFDFELYNRLKKYSNFIIHHGRFWQGFVDDFLRKKNIYPNDSILNGKHFIITDDFKSTYNYERGLEESMIKARDNGIFHEDIIERSNK